MFTDLFVVAEQFTPSAVKEKFANPQLIDSDASFKAMEDKGCDIAEVVDIKDVKAQER